MKNRLTSISNVNIGELSCRNEKKPPVKSHLCEVSLENAGYVCFKVKPRDLSLDDVKDERICFFHRNRLVISVLHDL